MQIPFNAGVARVRKLSRFQRLAPWNVVCASLLFLAPQVRSADQESPAPAPPGDAIPAAPDKAATVPKADPPSAGANADKPSTPGDSAPSPPAGEADPLLPDLQLLPPPATAPDGMGTRRSAHEIPADEDPDLDETDGNDAVEKPATFTLPGFYGTAPQQYTVGEGRMALSKLRTSVSLGLGYDDNSNASSGSGSEGETTGSGFTNVSITTGYQTAGTMQIFLFDAHAGADFYWSEDDPSYSLSLGMGYQRRFVGPYSLTASASLSYSTQPDYSQVNYVRRDFADSDEEGGAGSWSADAQVGFQYHWSPQFSTVTSLAVSTRWYEGSRSDEDTLGITFGNEFRYRVNRSTWIAELRYEMLTYPNEGQDDADSLYILGGWEWRLGPFTTSTRLGAVLRTYEGGEEATSPYAEFAIGFQPSVQNRFNLSTRYGYETSGIGGGDTKTFRVGLSYTRVFTARLSGTLAVNFIDSQESIQGSGETISTERGGEGERIFDATGSLNYQLSSRMSLALSITATRAIGDTTGPDQDRNRIALNASYQF